MIDVKKYLPLAAKIARKRFKQFKHKYSFEDLFQNACVGLMEAANTYDEDRGVKFLSYAYTCIDWHIMTCIRDDKWFLCKTIDRFKADAPLSLDIKISTDSDLTFADTLPDKENYKYIDLKIAIDSLPKKLKTIIKLQYFNELSQTEISKLVGISQPKVSRLSVKALKILRSQMV